MKYLRQIGAGFTVGIVILFGIGLLQRNEIFRQWSRNQEMLVLKHSVSLASSESPCPKLEYLTSVAPDFSESLKNSGTNDLWLRGIFAYALGDFDSASRTFEDLHNQSQPTQNEMFWAGCAAWENASKQEAILAWQNANASGYFLNLAIHAGQDQKIDQAIALYNLTLEIDPELGEGWSRLAELQFARANAHLAPWEPIVTQAKRGVELDPATPRSHYILGYALWREGSDLATAEQELRMAVENRRDWLFEYALAGVLMDRHVKNEPVQLLEDVLSLSDIPAVRIALVRAYAADGQCQLMEQARRDTLAKFPTTQRELDSLCNTQPQCPCATQP